MAVLQSGNSPGTRIAAGNSVIHAAQSVDTAPIAKRFEEFRQAHAGYLRADRAVKRASLALQRQQAEVGKADVDEDGAVLGLAATLPGDGFPRQNPFKPLGAPAPATLCALGHEEEAEAVLSLTAAVKRQRGISEASLEAAKNAERAAKRVQKAMAPLEKLEKAREAAIAKRDALSQIWEASFAGLKRGARAAEDEGARGLFAALFERRATKTSAKRGGKGSGNEGAGSSGEAKPAAPARGGRARGAQGGARSALAKMTEKAAGGADAEALSEGG